MAQAITFRAFGAELWLRVAFVCEFPGLDVWVRSSFHGNFLINAFIALQAFDDSEFAGDFAADCECGIASVFVDAHSLFTLY